MTLEEIFELSKEHPIIFYDGVCNLCNGFVQMVIRHDHSGLIRFCALQDPGGTVIRSHLALDHDLDTAIGLHNKQIYGHSDVLKMVAESLGGKWHFLLPFYKLPKKFRDRIYHWVAHNRYKWFGKSETCMVPDPSLRHRFVC